MGRTKPLPIALPGETIAELCNRYHIRRLCLFGSVLRDDFVSSSDVDILVEFAPGRTPGLEFFRIQAELSEILGRPVDLNTPNNLSPTYREEVLKECRPIYDAA